MQEMVKMDMGGSNKVSEYMDNKINTLNPSNYQEVLLTDSTTGSNSSVVSDYDVDDNNSNSQLYAYTALQTNHNIDLPNLLSNYYANKFGIPVTDELKRILSSPEGANSPEFDNYCNNHFSEYREYFVDNYLGQHFAYTDDERNRLLSFNTLNEAMAYNDTIAEEASLRLQYKVLLYSEYSNYVKQSGDAAIKDLDTQVEKLVKSRLIMSSEEFNDMDIYDGFSEDGMNVLVNLPDNGGQAYLQDRHINPDGSIAYRCTFMGQDIYLSWPQIVNNGVNAIRFYNSNDEMVNELSGACMTINSENFNLIAFLKYVNDLENKYVGKRPRTPIESKVEGRDAAILDVIDLDDHGVLYDLLHYHDGYYYRSCIETMSDEEMRIYNYLFETEGRQSADEYLNNYLLQDKIVVQEALLNISNFANVSRIQDFSGYTPIEITSEEQMRQIMNDPTVICNYDEDGNIHFYRGRSGCIYMRAYYHGVETNYEVSQWDDNKLAGYFGIAVESISADNISFIEGLVNFFSRSDGMNSHDQKVREIVANAVSVYESGKLVYDVSKSVNAGVRNRAIKFAFGPLGTLMATSLSFASNVGNSKDAAINQGNDLASAWGYSLSSSVLDTVTDAITGKLPINLKMNSSFLLSIMNGAASGGVGYGLDLLLRDIYLNEHFSDNFSWETFRHQAMVSGITAGIFNADKIKTDIDFVKNGFSSFADSVGTWMHRKSVIDDSNVEVSSEETGSVFTEHGDVLDLTNIHIEDEIANSDYSYLYPVFINLMEEYDAQYGKGSAIQALYNSLNGSILTKGKLKSSKLKAFIKNMDSSSLNNFYNRVYMNYAFTNDYYDPVNTMSATNGYQLTYDDLGDFMMTRLNSGFFTTDQLKNIMETVNNRGYCDEYLGNYLKQIVNADGYTIYVKKVHSSDVSSIMDEGIRCLGTTTSGFGHAPTSIDEIKMENVAYEISNGSLFDVLSNLKNSYGISPGSNPINGSIIFALPNGEDSSKIFKWSNRSQCYVINPIYNLGFVGCNQYGVLDGSHLIGYNK